MTRAEAYAQALGTWLHDDSMVLTMPPAIILGMPDRTLARIAPDGGLQTRAHYTQAEAVLLMRFIAENFCEPQGGESQP